MSQFEPLALFFQIETTPPCGTEDKFAEGSNIPAAFLLLHIYKALCTFGSLKSLLIPTCAIIALGGGTGNTGDLLSQLSRSLRIAHLSDTCIFKKYSFPLSCARILIFVLVCFLEDYPTFS